MLIEVYHGSVHVATVNAPPTNVDDALEYAFRWTQNIDGSWSMGDSADRNDRVQVIAPLPVHFGREIGHRSTMVGDKFLTEDGDCYLCQGFGWEKQP